MTHSSPEIEEPPPPTGSWSRLYALVLVYTACFIALLFWITASLNR